MHLILKNIQQIIDDYDGVLPLHHYLKNVYSKNKKFGSRDRKAISDAMYNYYRYAPFYSFQSPMSFLKFISQKGFLKHPFLIQLLEDSPIEFKEHTEISNDQNSFSADINADYFKDLVISQPDVFIRILKNYNENINKLKQNNIPFKTIEISEIGINIISVPNGTALQNVLLESDYIIQDLSSQLSLINPLSKIENLDNIKYTWDVCSGAGGKSLLLKQLLPSSLHIATDIRESVLKNLQKRFQLHGFGKMKTEVVDASMFIPAHINNYDLIIADVPCSGSGTWGRNPEQHYFFSNNKVAQFNQLQYSIANNALSRLKDSGYMIYITCSIFKEENEDVVNRLLSNHSNISLIDSQIVKGVQSKADTLFYALLRKS